jgi:hypothetical protein
LSPFAGQSHVTHQNKRLDRQLRLGWRVKHENPRSDQSQWKCWRTYSLNYEHEQGGDDGEPWRRMFMSDAATAFAVLALLPKD